MIKSISSPDELQDIVDDLLSLFKKGYKVMLLFGDLGSGKTTLVQKLCKALAVEENVTSPTFSIIQEYHSPAIGLIYHMDLYRLQSKEELGQIGFAEYLDSGNICLIEWPLLGMEEYKMPYIRVDIDVENNNIRNFKITTHDSVDA